MLTDDQEGISRRFATRGPKDFSDIPLKSAVTGAPILVKALAFVDCRIIKLVEGGDHDIFIGEIVAGELQSGQPLVYYNGRYVELAPEAAIPAPFGAEMLDEAYQHYGSF